MKHYFKNVKFVLLTVITFLVILFFACKRQLDLGFNNNSNAIVQNAKDYFTTTIVAKENEMLALPYKTLAKNSNIRCFARMGKLSNKLLWNKATVYIKNGLEYTIVPVEEDIKPFTNKSYEAFRNLIFYRNKDGRMNMSVIEVLSNKNSEFGNMPSSIAKLAFENMYFNTQQQLANTNASILFYDSYYNLQSSFIIKDGVWNEAKIKLKNVRSSSMGNKQSSQTLENSITTQTVKPKTKVPLSTCGGGCETWYTVGYWYDLNTGEIVGDITIYNTYQTGNCGGNGASYGGSGAGSSNSGSATSSVSNNVNNICISTTIEKTLSSLNALIYAVQHDFILSNCSITFMGSTNLDNETNAQTSLPTIGPTGITNFTIKLNLNTLPNNSEEFTAKVVMHELLHALLTANGTAWDELIQHNEIATEYQTQIRDALMDIFPGLSSTDANALAWSGLEDSNAFKSLDIKTQINIENIRDKYRAPTGLGTHCN